MIFQSRWWYGSRRYTKDGVLGSTAQLFFKKVREETTSTELVYLLAKAWGIEDPSKNLKPASGHALSKLEKDIKAVVKAFAGAEYGKTPHTKFKSDDVVARRALALLYAHLLRVTVQDPALQTGSSVQNVLSGDSP